MTEAEVSKVVRDELFASVGDIGYRRIHKTLKSKGYICRRETVRPIVKQLYPDGVKLRKCTRLYRRRYVTDGPNLYGT